MAAPTKHAKAKSKTLTKTVQSISLDTSKQKEFEKEVRNKRKSSKSKVEETKKGTVYLGNIPHGFFEPDMKKFFKQFGNVTRLRLSHSKKTGGSKGYAFIEFEYEAVAKVVAETMNNYLMFERLLKCQLVPSDKVHPDLYKGSERRFSKPKAHRVAIKRHNNLDVKDKEEKASTRFAKKNKARMEKLRKMGIDVDFSSVVHDKMESEKSDGTNSIGLTEHSGIKAPSRKKRKTMTEEKSSDVNTKNKEIGKQTFVEPTLTKKEQLKRKSQDGNSDEAAITYRKSARVKTDSNTSVTAKNSVIKSVKGKNAGPKRLKTLKTSTQEKKNAKK